MNKQFSILGALALSLGSLQASSSLASASTTKTTTTQPAPAKAPVLMSLDQLRAQNDDSSAFSIFASYIGGVAGVPSTNIGSSGFFSNNVASYPTGTLFSMPSTWGNGGRIQLGYSAANTDVGISLSYEFFTVSGGRTVTAIPSTDPTLYPSLATSDSLGNANHVLAYEGTKGHYNLKYSQVVDLLFTGPAFVSTGCKAVLEPSVGMRGFFIDHHYHTTILTPGPTSTSYQFAENVSGVGAITSLFMRQNLFGSMESMSFGLQAKPTLGLVWGHHKLSQSGSQTTGATTTPVLSLSDPLDAMHGLVDAEIGLYGKFATDMASFELSTSILGEFWPSFSYLVAMGPTAGQPSTFSVVALLVTLGAIF